jgi:hypothetical protein
MSISSVMRRISDSRAAAEAGLYEPNEHSELSNCARRATYPTHQVKKITHERASVNRQ